MPAQFRVGKIEGARHKGEFDIQERRLCVSWLRCDEWDDPAAHEPGVTVCKFTLSEEYEQRNESAACRPRRLDAGWRRGCHSCGADKEGRTRGFQLWLALPPKLELGPSASLYQGPEAIQLEDPLRACSSVATGSQCRPCQ